MKLHFRTLGQGAPMIIMHGVFGSADNWQTVGKALSEKFKIYLVDLRNHGNSPHSEAFNYEVMSDDIHELMQDEELDKACLLGHSMGGKVAMTFSMKYPQMVEKLIVVDIAPREYPPHHQQIFKGFRAVTLENIHTRSDADKEMSMVINNAGIRQFILKNLYRNKDGKFSWKLNLAAIENAANYIGDPLLPSGVFEKEALFIGGSKSDYIQDSDREAIKKHFPNANVIMIKDAGHWVHAEQPEALINTVRQFLT